jgi:hypothetical protein
LDSRTLDPVRREPDFFGDQELVLVYMARRLKDALAVEKIFEERGPDYALETGHYQSGLLFRTTKIGVFFYVMPQDEGRARALLLEQGKKAYDAVRDSR